MATWEFRQSDGPKIRERLFAQAQRGKLRQGWSYSRDLSLEQDKASWLRAYRKAGYSPKHKPDPTYRDLVKMLKVEPGDLIVVPKQPDNSSFFLARAVANPWGKVSACYCFLRDQPVESEWGDDFRSCITVDPTSIREFKFHDARVPELLRKAFFGQGAWYRSKIQRVSRADVNQALDKLTHERGAALPQQEPRSRSVLSPARSRQLIPFSPLADSNYFQVIQGGTVVRSRHHQTLVNAATYQLKAAGATVTSKGRIDLYVSAPHEVIFEAKILHADSVQALREGLGQLFWYRFEQGLPRASLCLLVDRQPIKEALDCLETGVGVSVVWRDGRQFYGRALTLERLRDLEWITQWKCRTA